MRHLIIACFLFSIEPSPLEAQTSGSEQTSKNHPPKVATIVQYHQGLLNINKMAMRVQNDGLLGIAPPAYIPPAPTDPLQPVEVRARPPFTSWGLAFPRGTAGLMYAENLVWVGQVNDGRQPQLRTGGGLWTSGTLPGSILQQGVAENPDSPSARVYRFRKDFRTADLRQDASEVFNVSLDAVTDVLIRSVRDQYEKDLNEWPWQKGAPFKDLNKNGVMDGEDYPDVQDCDQVVWFSYNDLDEEMNRSFYGGPSIGLEVQVTLWAYKDVPEFENIIFKRFRLVYKGTASTPADAVIDSMYLSQWADPDVGSFGDDLGGCDSLLSMGFVYNGAGTDMFYKPFGWQNPAIGYMILQGPLVSAEATDEGVYNFSKKIGTKNLPMTAFLLNATGDAISEPARGRSTPWFWNVARGYSPWGSVWTDSRGAPTTYMASGDPVTGSGWVDGRGRITATLFSYYSGERRFVMSTGPFTMALGDEQEMVIAIIANFGADGKSSTAVLKHDARIVRGIYPQLAEKVKEAKEKQQPVVVLPPNDFVLAQNYPNPFNPATRIDFTLPIGAAIRLAVFDLLGREVRVLEKGEKAAGKYSTTWDGRDGEGRLIPSGMYIYRLDAGHIELSRRLLIIR